MQFLILGLLMIAPMSQYDLHKAFSAGLSLFYSASLGSIQRALTQLVERGFIQAHRDPTSARGKKVHTITPEGVAAWRDWMLEPVSGSNAETTMLSRVYLLGLLPAGAERERCLAVLTQSAGAALSQLRGVAAHLDAQEVPEAMREAFEYQRATLDYGIRSHELALAWLAELSG